jgi:PAS domain S-box-containing protein
VASGAALVAIVLRWLLDPLLGDSVPFITLFGAVAAAVWIGGYGPALLAAAVGYLGCTWLFVPPRGVLSLGEPQTLVALGAYTFTCALIIGIGSAMQAAQRRATLGQETLRVTFESMGDAVITTDAAGRITSMNGIAEDLTGWSAKEATGEPLADVLRIVNEETREPVPDPAASVLRTGIALGLADHTILVRKDGGERPIDDSAAPIRNASGAIVGCVLVFRDITERRRMESRLDGQLTDARFFRSIIESSQDAIISKTLDSVVLSWNSAAEKLFGYTAAQAIGRHISFVIPVERRHEEEQIIARLRDGERIEHFETERVRSDGGRVPVSLTISPIRDESGRIVGASKIARDVSDRVQDMNEIRLRNLRLKLLSEAAGFLLSTSDADAMLHGIHDKVGPHLGADTYLNFMVNEAGDALRLASWAGIPDDVAAGIRRLEFGQAVCGAVAVGREPIHATHIQQSADPRDELVKSFGLRAYASNPLFAGAELIGTLSFASRTRDAFSPDELVFIATITHYVSIAYERLRLLDRLRDADRRKDEFLATLAHELRSPLAPLRNGIEIMKLAPESGEVLGAARGSMERQLAQLVRLVDDLLDVSRVTRNRLGLRRGRVELAEVIEHAVETCRPLADAALLELKVTLPEEPVFLDADAARLSQVFSNLLNNACKYTEPGGRIWLEADRQGDSVRVSVRDTGVGIPADKLGGIFEMFAQVDESLERAQGGLGIGLTLAHRLVEMHGGTLEAQSEGAGRGSEFVVRLPALAGARMPVEVNDMDETTSGLRSRILIVDDNVDSATSLAMLLSTTGHETEMAHDGLQALEVAERFRPHVVLLDIGLPKLNGYDACRRIRERPWGRDVTLVAVTGWGQDSDRRKSREAGFDHHMVKPVEFASLTRVLAGGRPTVSQG